PGRITIRSSRNRFAVRLNSSVRRQGKVVSKLKQATRIVGWLWLLLATAGLAYAALMVSSDFRQPEAEDPSGAGLVLGALLMLVLLPLALCGADLPPLSRTT